MAMSNVELYEALKGSIPEAAARMIAEHFPPSRDLATTHDLARMGESLRAEMQTGFASLRGEIHAESARTMRWMLTFFIPVWAGTWGTVVAVLLRG
jgi:hypothetical protein